MPDQFIYSTGDVLRMLDALVMGRGGAWWSEFLANHVSSCPFLVDWPDENLAEWLSEGLLAPGGSYGLVCFRPEGGSGYTDQQVMSGRASAAVWVIPRIACMLCGTPHRFPCACCGR